MSHLLRILTGIFNMFGGLIVFWVALLAFGTTTAIAATLLFVLVDGSRRLIRREKLPPLYLPSALLGIGFGIIDLMAPTPFMLKWEPLIGNLLIAGFFAAGARAEVPLTAQFAAQSGAEIPLNRPEVMRFMRFWTWVWAAYFVVRGIVYVWIMHAWPLVEALAIRTVVGWVSLALMIGLSFTGRRLMRLFQALGFFRPAAAPPAGAAITAE
jgi:uncharacterized membrane protein